MKRKFSAEGVMHAYQRTVSGFNLFYTLEDFIVYYTIVAVEAKKFRIRLMGLCMMIDHIHMLLRAGKRTDMSNFISACSSLYVREFNAQIGRRGKLFESSFGSAVKLGSKKIRSAIAYLFNNPVEKMLCKRAEEYRWNFLAYYANELPFSTRPKHMSRKIKRSISLIDEEFKNGRHLRYALLDIIFKNTNNEEKMFLIDYIISKYFPFEKDELIGYYKSYKDMLTAVNSNTGSEYEIAEKHYCKNDTAYREIIFALQKDGCSDIRKVITMPEDKKVRYMTLMKKLTSASNIQLRKFFHLANQEAKSTSQAETAKTLTTNKLNK